MSKDTFYLETIFLTPKNDVHFLLGMRNQIITITPILQNQTIHLCLSILLKIINICILKLLKTNLFQIQ